MNEKTFPIREFIFAFLEMKIVHIDIGSSYSSQLGKRENKRFSQFRIQCCKVDKVTRLVCKVLKQNGTDLEPSTTKREKENDLRPKKSICVISQMEDLESEAKTFLWTILKEKVEFSHGTFNGFSCSMIIREIFRTFSVKYSEFYLFFQK